VKYFLRKNFLKSTELASFIQYNYICIYNFINSWLIIWCLFSPLEFEDSWWRSMLNFKTPHIELKVVVSLKKNSIILENPFISTFSKFRKLHHEFYFLSKNCLKVSNIDYSLLGKTLQSMQLVLLLLFCHWEEDSLTGERKFLLNFPLTHWNQDL
jgi:hypothetical protein